MQYMLWKVRILQRVCWLCSMLGLGDNFLAILIIKKFKIDNETHP